MLDKAVPVAWPLKTVPVSAVWHGRIALTGR